MVRFAEVSGTCVRSGMGRSPAGIRLSPEYPSSRTSFLVRETLVEPALGIPERLAPVPEEGNEPRGLPSVAPDLDALLEMEDEIQSLSVQIHVATHRLLVVLAEFDGQRGWEVGGHRCCADWLAYRTGIDRGAARERVRAARALQKLPMIGEAMANGDLSFSQVRALTRVATPDTQEELLSLAMENSSPALERIVRAWRRGNRKDEARREEELHRSRCLSVFPDEEGMYVVKGVLPAELGLLLMRALDAASDALFREEGRTPAAVDPEGHRAAGARRRADALGLVAERALAVGFTAEEGAPVSGTRPERYQVVLHVEEETLRGEEAVPETQFRPRQTRPDSGRCGRTPGTQPEDGTPGSAPRSHLDDGTRVSMETSRRLCCDAAVVTVLETREGQPLNISRKSRTIPPALRRALEVRDQGCRFPGCGCRFTDAHHVIHWADGGETSLANCLLLCRFHHRLLHEGGWRIQWWGKGKPLFLDPRGGAVFDGGWKEPTAG